jgi:Myb/SANT-like DNA-binding domain
MTEQAKKEGSAKWNPVIKKVLVTVLLSESNGRFSNMSNDKTGWLRVVGSFNKSTGLLYTKSMLATQSIANMKAQFMEFEKYANQSGFGMDSNGMVTGSPESLTTCYASHPKARQLERLRKLVFSKIRNIFRFFSYNLIGVLRQVAKFRLFSSRARKSLSILKMHPLNRSP